MIVEIITNGKEIKMIVFLPIPFACIIPILERFASISRLIKVPHIITHRIKTNNVNIVSINWIELINLGMNTIRNAAALK
jgi:hypothetical protein